MPECGYCSKEFATGESYCHTLAAAMDCAKVDLVQRAVLTAVAESIEKGATVDLGDGQFCPARKTPRLRITVQSCTEVRASCWTSSCRPIKPVMLPKWICFSTD
jgi:hypothetical protein